MGASSIPPDYYLAGLKKEKMVREVEKIAKIFYKCQTRGTWTAEEIFCWLFIQNSVSSARQKNQILAHSHVKTVPSLAHYVFGTIVPIDQRDFFFFFFEKMKEGKTKRVSTVRLLLFINSKNC